MTIDVQLMLDLYRDMWLVRSFEFALEREFKKGKAPVRRVCGLDTPIPFSLPLEKIILPDQDDIKTTIQETMDY